MKEEIDKGRERHERKGRSERRESLNRTGRKEGRGLRKREGREERPMNKAGKG